MTDISVARKLLDFGARMGQGQRADEQLEGAVAIHNILERQGVAYLADEARFPVILEALRVKVIDELLRRGVGIEPMPSINSGLNVLRGFRIRSPSSLGPV